MANDFQALSDAMADVIDSVSPALVRVNARRRLPATGIIQASDGLIVTAHHVVQRDDNISVTTFDAGGDETHHEAQLVGRDPQNDLALLKVDADLTPPEWGDSNALRVGNLVMALGRPGEQPQATLGMVSALVSSREHQPKRKRKRGRRRMRALADGYIQTDVVMYPGFSGGALVGADGRIYGLNTSGFGQGRSVSVPVNTIEGTVNTLRAHGRMQRGYLGVGVQAVRLPEAVADELDQETGLLIVSIEDGSPAGDANLLVGDIIVTLDDTATDTMDDLLALLTGERIGQDVTVQLVRGGQMTDVTVNVAARE
jgi:S1-C subfamily serine protease